jgi:hypothetical protein
MHVSGEDTTEVGTICFRNSRSLSRPASSSPSAAPCGDDRPHLWIQRPDAPGHQRLLESLGDPSAFCSGTHSRIRAALQQRVMWGRQSLPYTGGLSEELTKLPIGKSKPLPAKVISCGDPVCLLLRHARHDPRRNGLGVERQQLVSSRRPIVALSIVDRNVIPRVYGFPQTQT